MRLRVRCALEALVDERCVLWFCKAKLLAMVGEPWYLRLLLLVLLRSDGGVTPIVYCSGSVVAITWRPALPLPLNVVPTPLLKEGSSNVMQLPVVLMPSTNLLRAKVDSVKGRLCSGTAGSTLSSM